MCIVYSMLAILWIHARECATVETHTNIHEHCNFVPKGESLVWHLRHTLHRTIHRLTPDPLILLIAPTTSEEVHRKATAKTKELKLR